MRTLLLAIAAVGVAEGLLMVNPAHPPVNGLAGVFSPGFYEVSPGAQACTLDAGASIFLGNMTTFDIVGQGTGCQLSQGAKFNSGSYSLTTLERSCQLSLGVNATVTNIVSPHQATGRAEIYCNATLTLGDNSFLLLNPQTKLNIRSSFNLGKSNTLKIYNGAVLSVSQPLQIADRTQLTLMDHANFNITPTASGIVTITSSRAGPTTVTLRPSSKIISEGTMTIGNGQLTHVNLFENGLLHITPNGHFTIASATFDIGPSSFWIIDGDFSFDEGSSLSSGLQSNITVSAKWPKGGIMKTLTGGTVSVAAGASMSIFGVAEISGKLLLASPAQAVINGGLAIGSGSLFIVGSFSGVSIDRYLSVQLIAGSRITIGERALLYFKYEPQPGNAPTTCFNFGDIVVPDYKVMIVSTKTPHGFLCH